MSVAVITEIPLPRLSDSMEEGTIVRWLRSDGDAVSPGDPVVEIETDKATMEYEAEHGGILEVIVAAGSTVPLGTTIARLLPVGSEPSPGGPASAVGGSDATVDPATPERSRPVGADPTPAARRTMGQRSNGERILATPVARRLAAARGIDLASLTPTGRRGQIVKADVPTEGAAPALPTATEPVAAALGSERPSVRREVLTRTQRTIAQRMSESRALVPDFEVAVDIDMTACVELRAQLVEHLDPVPSLNDMVVKATALALRAHPRVNGAYRDDGFDLYADVNVGIAVASEDALLVAVVRDADRASLRDIAAQTRRLADRARTGEITPPELSGATFTVSNLGMFGIDRFTAIVNTPQAAILAVGAAVDRPVARDGEVKVRRVMTATLASDHRILYGADAARFITDLRDRLQAPLSLLI